MTEYPLKVKIWEADYNQPNPTGKVAHHIVRGKYDSDVGFVIIDPYNGNERSDVYASREDANLDEEDNSFLWVEEVIRGEDPRVDEN